jgi:hypothetical protein
MVRIAFGHKKRVGKDTACDYLISKYGGIKMSFAEPLYDILHHAQRVCGFEVSKDRPFLQFVGTEWARSKDADVWVKLLSHKVSNSAAINDNIFVSDLRFRNEFAMLKTLGFACVLINSGQRSLQEHIEAHQSETELLDSRQWDYVIDNKDALQDFYHQLDTLYIGLPALWPAPDCERNPVAPECESKLYLCR